MDRFRDFFFEWQLRPTERMVHRILHLAVIALQPIFKSVQNAQRRHASVPSFPKKNIPRSIIQKYLLLIFGPILERHDHS